MATATLSPTVHEHFAVLARAWLAAGASSFVVAEGDRTVAHWPAQDPVSSNGIAEPCVAVPCDRFQISVKGLSGRAWEARLQADVALLGSLLQREEELDRMTVDLIDRQDELLALYELTNATRGHLSIEDALRALSEAATQLMAARGAVVVLCLPDSEPLIIRHQAPVLTDDQALVYHAQLQSAGRHLLLGATQGAEPPRADISQMLLTPLRVRDRSAGSLIVVDKRAGPFDAADLKLARAISDQTAAQVERVLVHREGLAQVRLKAEYDLGARISSRLLPAQPPNVPGLDIAAQMRLALQVGGDLYDFVWPDSQPFTFSVGDVSGKGLSAALLMAVTQYAFRSAVKWTTSNPGTGIHRLNVDLYNSLSEVDMFVTFFIGCFDIDTQQLRYVNAGHSPVLYRPREGPAQLLQADGPAIGVLPVCLCETQYLRLDPGDLLVVCTDGFSEAHSPSGELFGYERLLQLADQTHALPAKEIANAFFDAVTTFGAGRAQDDDQTLVVLRGTPS